MVIRLITVLSATNLPHIMFSFIHIYNYYYYTYIYIPVGSNVYFSHFDRLPIHFNVYMCVCVYHREELGQDMQTTLLQYLTTVLTKWNGPYIQKADKLMSLIPNKRNVLDLFSKLLFTKVLS